MKTYLVCYTIILKDGMVQDADATYEFKALTSFAIEALRKSITDDDGREGIDVIFTSFTRLDDPE